SPVTLSTFFFSIFLTAPSPPYISSLSLHDALPIFLFEEADAVFSVSEDQIVFDRLSGFDTARDKLVLDEKLGDLRVLEWAYLRRSEEHTSELQSLTNIVCRLLLEKNKLEHKIPPAA